MSVTLTSPNGAIDADEFADLLKCFQPLSDKIAVAVSGGPDSMALAVCTKRWAQSDMIALIVDHGLRAESAKETAHVTELLEKMGIRVEILRWSHDPISGGLHEKARAARYDLLLGACRQNGIRDLLVAHHREDQAETILMRLAKGSGIEGLAGMAPQTPRKGIRVLRPFLSVSKERLILTCHAANTGFITDPSNASEKFARGRLRKILPLLADEGMTIEALVGLGGRAADASEALDYYTKEFLRVGAQCEIGGTVTLDRQALGALPRAIALRALARSLRYVHEAEHPPEYGSLSSLLDAVLHESLETARTFYGCIASLSKSKVMILREPAGVIHATPLRAGQATLWDKRWLVTTTAKFEESLARLEQGFVLRALGTPPHETIDLLAPHLRHQIPQGRVRASLPAIWLGDKIHAIPDFDEKASFHLAYQKQSFP